MCHSDDFKFFVVETFEKAIEIIRVNRDIDLLFVDADEIPISEASMFISHVKEVQPKLPIIVFTDDTDERMRILMRDGAAWHFTKQSQSINRLAKQIHWYVFSPTNWGEFFSKYSRNNIKPRIEPGLSYSDLEGLNSNPEEQFIIKRLFAGSEVVQIFRMDQGFSGSRIYTVKPEHQLKRILKIDVADRLEAVQEKQERLILPRLNRRVGQIQGNLVRGEHLAGACYTLAGSTNDAITLTQFLQDQNKVRKELVDKILQQLRISLEQLYAGSSDTELRYWAPLYSRVLPTYFTLDDAVMISPQEADSFDGLMLRSSELSTLSSVPSNKVLAQINQAVREGENPEVTLHNFEIAEIDTQQGVIYLHDELISKYPVSNLIKDKNHPILRFKIRLNQDDRNLITHPVFRRGKRITVTGIVRETQESILANNISEVTGRPYNFEEDIFEFGGGRFIPPINNIRHLLWEIGREDMIVPLPQVSPVVHGDLNTSNILVEVSENIPVWLIDFSDARPGHLFFDLAKLEVEFRTHVLFKLFKDMVDEGIWSEEKAIQFALLIENILQDVTGKSFADFISAIREHQPDWYDNLYTHFPLYSENLLYFLYSLRKIAESYSPERFKHHFPVAIFFHSITALKYKGLDLPPWKKWSKRLALCCALVSGKQALRDVERPAELGDAVSKLRQRSSFSLITVGVGDDRKYLLQWNANWGMFNLVGGRLDNEKGDKDSFARTIQRELNEELGLTSHKDYRITKEFKPLFKRQFSRRQNVFKDYEFRVFKIELLPRHPMTVEDYHLFENRLSSERENILVSRAEIERLRSFDNRPISETTRAILQDLGEIPSIEDKDLFTPLDFVLDGEDIIVSRGKAQINGRLHNPEFGNLVENITIEVLPSPNFDTQQGSSIHQISKLDVNEEESITIWLQPKEKDAKLTVRLTFYDAKGHEFRQLIELPIRFISQMRNLFHIDNPYVVGKPLTSASETLYVGRRDIFSWIEENLIGKTQPHTLILYGQRRMGKTSTLYQLIEGKLGQPIREYPGYPIYPVYIDLQRLVGCDTPAFFKRISMTIHRDLTKRGISLPTEAAFDVNGSPFTEFDRFLDIVESQVPNEGLLVLVIDELEQLQDSIQKGRLTEEILTYLRSLMQHRSRMTFILAGTNQLVEDYWSVIFHVGLSREIEPLTRDDTENLIRQPVSPIIEYDDLAIDHIWLATRGQPYFTQLICHRLISAVNLQGKRSFNVTSHDVIMTIEKIVVEDDSHLQHIWNESSKEEQNIMSVLAGTQNSSGEAFSRAVIANRLQDFSLDHNAINQSLERLETRGLVQRIPVEREISRKLAHGHGWQPTLISKDYTYSLAFGLLRKWILQKHPLGFVIR
ncbi:MAG: AAA family ATPase [Chloroflexota bacterium]